MIRLLFRLTCACGIGLLIGTVASYLVRSQDRHSVNDEPPVSLQRSIQPTSEPLDEQVAAVLERGSVDAGRTSMLAANIRRASPRQLRTVLDRLELDNDPLKGTLIAMALKRWLKRDPSGAVDYVNARENLWVTCIAQWAEVDPTAAAQALTEGRIHTSQQQYLAATLVRRVAESDPHMALSFADRLSIRPVDEAYGAIIRGLLNEGATIAVAALEGVSASTKARAKRAVAAEWGLRDGAAALSWLQTQPKTATALVILGNAWAKHDPQAVLTHLDDLAKYPNSRPSLMANALANWWAQDAEAAQGWLENASLADDEAERVQSRLILELAKTDPQAALELNTEAVAHGHASQGQHFYQTWAKQDPHAVLAWAQSQPAGTERSDSLLAAIQELSQRDPVAMLEKLPELAPSSAKRGQWNETATALIPVLSAQGQVASEQWIDSLPANIRTAFYNAYSDQWQERAPEEALDYLASQSIDRDLIDIAQNVVGKQLARKDPQAAAELVAEFQDTQMREVGTRNILSNWLATEPQQAEAWVNSLTDPPMRDKAFQFMAEHYQRIDREKAFVYARQVEDEYQRYESVRTVISQIGDSSQAVAYIEQSDLLEADRETLLSVLRLHGSKPHG